MNWPWQRIKTDTSGIGITILLLVTLVAVNCVAVWTILVARRNVQVMALQDLELRTTAQARSIEALLATLRGDFLFLTQSPPLASALRVLSNPNPLVQRWGRLDIEGTFLLFLQAHPEVAAIVLRDESGGVRVFAGRRESAPVILPPADSSAGGIDKKHIWVSQWPVGNASAAQGAIETFIDMRQLLRISSPGNEDMLQLIPEPAARTAPSGPDSMVAEVPVQDEHWSNPIHWTLVRTENQSRLISSVANLAAHYRSTIVLNLVVVTLAFILGLVALRQVRRSTFLEAENRHQAQVRELERQIMHSERLASVGRLAAGLAHEINNPLEGMANYLSLLEEDLQAESNAGCLELTAGVKEGLHRAAAITRQVLAFSDPGRSPKTPVDLREIVKETFDFVRSNPGFRQVRLQLAIPNHSLTIRGNRITLGQVVLNLILNACEYQDGDGDVLVSLSTVEGKRVELSVSDRGPGIPEEALPKIFEPFFSTRGSTGLGLSLCHAIVEEHGGRVSAANRSDGPGAVFRVELPLDEPVGAPATPEKEAAQN